MLIFEDLNGLSAVLDQNLILNSDIRCDFHVKIDGPAVKLRESSGVVGKSKLVAPDKLLTEVIISFYKS